MVDDSRIGELRRRIRKDPASLAFAQLAEELRRSRRFLEAAAVCRAGLEIYPQYLSARVTLGRCLIDLHRLDDGQRELERVLEIAPENLVAVRAMAEIRESRGAGDVRLKPETTYQGLKPDTTYEGAAVRLRPDARYDRETPEVRLKPAVRYDGAALELLLRPTEVYDGPMPEVQLKPDAMHEDQATDGHAVRTLAALEGLLAAIHVTRAHRSA